MDKSTGLRFDHTVVLSGFHAQRAYPEPPRRIGYPDPQTGKALVFLSNNFAVPALAIARIYQGRWQIGLFFKWIQQHPRINAFYGTSQNAVRTQSRIVIFGLSAGGDSQKASASGLEPLHDFTDFESDVVQENIDFTGTFSTPTGK